MVQKARTFLENNKIFFEIFSNVILGIMGIIISISAIRLTKYPIHTPTIPREVNDKIVATNILITELIIFLCAKNLKSLIPLSIEK